jgi:hypothetical protein
MKIGIVYGKFMLLQKLSISYGGFVEGAYQRASVFKKGVYCVLHLVLFVITILKMIGMCCFIVNLVPIVELVPAWTSFSRLGFSKARICVILYIISVSQMIKMQQGCLLLLFCGVTVTIAFGITQRSREGV